MNPFLMPAGGACVQVPHLMHPDPRDLSAVEEAVETCLSCPAYLACLAWYLSLNEDPGGGVIAGLTFEERNPADVRSCVVCGETKRHSEFGLLRPNAPHRRRTCKACMAARKQELRSMREEVAA